MRQTLFLTGLLGSALSLSASDYYSFTNVKRVENNLYSGSSGFNSYLIETSLCLHLTIGENATLKWDGLSGTIIWQDNSTCQVTKILHR